MKPTFISVSLDSGFKSHAPLFLLLVSLAQAFFFLAAKEPFHFLSSDASRKLDNSLLLRSVGDWPGCEDQRSEHAWRMISYQFVHNSWQHLTFNIVLQILYGLPIVSYYCGSSHV